MVQKLMVLERVSSYQYLLSTWSQREMAKYTICGWNLIVYVSFELVYIVLLPTCL